MARKKGILRVLIVYLLAITQFGCEKDLYQIDSQNIIRNNNLKTYPITGEKAKLQAEKLSKKLKLNLSAKGVQLKTNNGLIVDYEKVMVLENEYDQMSYSFKANTNSETPNSFKNVVMLEKNGTTVIKLVTYQMTPEFAEQYRADTKNLAQFDGTISITDLNNTEDCCGTQPVTNLPITGGNGDGWGVGYSGGSGGSSPSSGGSSTISSGSAFCPSGQHLKGDPSCVYEQTSGPAVSNRIGVNPNIGTIGNVINNTSNVDRLELCCITDFAIFNEVMFERDCEKMKNIVNPLNGNTKQSIDQLKAKVTANESNEWSASIEKTTVNGSDNFNSQLVEGTSSGSELKIDLNYVGSAHTHPSDGISMYSWIDMLSLYRAYSKTSTNNKQDVTLILICKDPDNGDVNTYALKINQPNKLVYKLYKDLGGIGGITNESLNELINDKDKVYEALINNNDTYQDNDNLEKQFLKNWSDAGVSIFKADDNLNWSKLELGGTPQLTTVVSVPCN
jgi:hypothetical protein